MSIENRDYGRIKDYGGFPRVPIEEPRTQVYQATHNGRGGYLPFMERSFISFTFGGKRIEDFGFIAVINGNSYQFNGYSNFEDIVSKYDIIDGHKYWGTHFTDHEIDFRLATDGVTEIQLQDFLTWFSPGKVRELILSEHPNRAIMARVGTPPELNVIPFKQKAIKVINARKYETYTTLYKGYIQIHLVMDEPFWYSKVNIFGYLGSDGIYHDTWTNANGNVISIYDDPDAIKVALEDNIPISGMIENAMLLGDDKIAFSDSDTYARIADKESYDPSEWQGGLMMQEPFVIATVNSNNEWLYGARIAGLLVKNSGGIANFPIGRIEYFYYCGTAPCYPILKFSLTPQFDVDGFINSPANSYARTSSVGTDNYNTITIGSTKEKNFSFTTPSVYTAYNQVIKIINDSTTTTPWEDIRKKIRDQVNHQAVRAWANKVIDSFLREQDSDLTVSLNFSSFKTRMKYFLKDEEEKLLSSSFTINSKTGEAQGEMRYRRPYLGNATDWLSFGTIVTVKEDVGDMVRSNYLIIEERNRPKNGQIAKWNQYYEDDKLNSHYIKHNVANGLQDVSIIYKNMYL